MGKNQHNIKSYLKFLRNCNQKKLVGSIIKFAPDDVIKRICDAALNVQQGDVKLSKREKEFFRNQKKTFKKLISTSIPIEKKRKFLTRNQIGGGVPFVPALLNTVFNSLGSTFLSSRKKCLLKSIN